MGVGSNPSNLQDLEFSKNYKFVKGDISNFHLVNKIIGKVDVIVNFAAETQVDRSIVNPNAFLQSNTIGTFTILESMRKHKSKAKFIQVSTGKVYGETLEESFHRKISFKSLQPLFSFQSSLRNVHHVLS